MCNCNECMILKECENLEHAILPLHVKCIVRPLTNIPFDVCDFLFKRLHVFKCTISFSFFKCV